METVQNLQKRGKISMCIKTFSHPAEFLEFDVINRTVQLAK